MKLPEIQRTAAQSAQSMSPGQAAAPYLAKIKVGEQVASMINNVIELKDETQLSNANSDYRDSLQSFNNWYEQQKTFTPEDIETMGIDGEVDTSGGDIPAWKVRTAALNKFTEDMQQQLGGTISNKSKRNAWISDTKTMTAPLIERSIQESANMGVQEMVSDSVERYQDALDRGNYIGARQALNSIPVHTPALKAEFKRFDRELTKLEYSSEQQLKLDDALDDAVDNGDFAALEMMAIEAEDDESITETPWDQPEHTAWAKTIRAASKAAQTAEAAKFVSDSGNLSKEMLAGIIEGKVFSISIAQRRNLTSSDYRYLVNQLDSDDSNVSSDELTLAVIAGKINDISMGNGNKSLSFSDQILEMRNIIQNSGIVVDPITNEQRVQITSSDSFTLFTKLDAVGAAPFATLSPFGVVSEEVRNRILGYQDGAMSFESLQNANLNEEAQRSLRKYVEDNGPLADVEAWREKRLPYYLEERSRFSFYALPRSIRDGAVSGAGGKVSTGDTLKSLSLILTKAIEKNSTSPSPKREEMIRVAKENIQQFEAWANGEGVNYVVK